MVSTQRMFEDRMEILPGVHQITMDYHNRPLKLYLIVAGDESLLMDTGDASTPEAAILPYFQASYRVHA